MDQAVELHRQLVHRESHSGAWIDLGSAQESAGFGRTLATRLRRPWNSIRSRLLHIMRLGSAEALEAKLPEALAAFAEAERLYRKARTSRARPRCFCNERSALEYAGDLRGGPR